MNEPISHDGEPRSIPMRIGRYRPKSVLGTGRCSVVFLAVDPVLDARVAIKLSKPLDGEAVGASAERLLAEAQVTRRVACAAVPTVFDAGRLGGEAYMVTDLFLGGTLMERLVRGAVGDPWTTKAVGRCLRDALDSAHRIGVTHRDVTPVNIFVASEHAWDSSPSGDLVRSHEHLVLGDFGIASAIGAPVAAGQMKGARQFAAPEQRIAGAPVGVASDVYSATAVIVSTLSGALPPARNELDSLLGALRPAWAAFVAKGLAREEDSRFDNMDSWFDALMIAINTDLREAGFDAIVD